MTGKLWEACPAGIIGYSHAVPKASPAATPSTSGCTPSTEPLGGEHHSGVKKGPLLYRKR